MGEFLGAVSFAGRAMFMRTFSGLDHREDAGLYDRREIGPDGSYLC
jgi:hypothetical protein